jgi:predicted amidohydrolase
MRIVLAQINNTIGDLEANAARILDFARRAEHAGAVIERGRIVFRQSKMLLPNYYDKTCFQAFQAQA